MLVIVMGIIIIIGVDNVFRIFWNYNTIYLKYTLVAIIRRGNYDGI